MNYFLFFLVIFSSCSEQNANVETNSIQENYDLDEKKCVDFAVQVHSSFIEGDTNYVDQYIAWDVIQESLESQQGSEFDDLQKSIFDHLKDQVHVGQDLMGFQDSLTQLKFMTYFQENGDHFVVLRRFQEPQTIDFIELKLSSYRNTLAVTDLYFYDQSVSLSQLIGAEVIYFESRGGNWKSDLQAWEQKVQQVNQWMQEGNILKAYQTLKEVDDPFKSTLMFSLKEEEVLSSSEDPEVLLNLLAKKAKRIGAEEKGKWLTWYYLYAYQGKYEDASIAWSNLEDEVGSDAIMRYLKANLYFEMGKYDLAMEELNAALSEEQHVLSIHLLKVLCWIEVKEYEKAVETLLVMDDYFQLEGIDWDLEFTEYSEFLISDAYAEWIERTLTSSP